MVVVRAEKVVLGAVQVVTVTAAGVETKAGAAQEAVNFLLFLPFESGVGFWSPASASFDAEPAVNVAPLYRA